MGRKAQKQILAESASLAAAQAQQIAELRGQLAEAERKLREKQIVCERAGTMAEAAMTLSGVYKAADEAAAQYLENIRAFTEQQREVCAQIERTTREKAEAMLRETEERCRAREREADAYWEKLSAKFEQFCAEHQELRNLLEEGRNPR